MSPRARTALVCGLALFGVYLPSSVSRVISHPLNILALTGTLAGMLALLALGRGPGSKRAIQAACAVAGLLALGTLLSPFTQLSPGVVILYVTFCVMLATDLRVPQDARMAVRGVATISVISLLLGGLLIADVGAVDWVVVNLYSAFRPPLVSEMVEVANKPVLTFATHSMAAFMVYLLFYLSLSAHQCGRGRAWLASAAGHLFLLTHLRSTTATLLILVAISQLAWLPIRRLSVRARLAGLGLLAVLLVAAGAWLASDPALVNAARLRVLGDEGQGFIARYASGGLLSTNMEYLAAHPFTPIGVTFAPSLYLGDSGLIVNALRGSLPLVLAVYGGVIAFALGNVRSRFAGVWLGVLIVAFEVGFTPLQYFRFLGVLPLFVVFLNAIQAGAGPTLPPPASWPALRRGLWRHRGWLAAALLAGAVLGGLASRVAVCCHTARAVVAIGPPFLLDNSRHWYAEQVEARAKNPEVFAAVLRSHPRLLEELGMSPVSFRSIGLAVERRDDDRAIAITVSQSGPATIELLANALAAEVIRGAKERYRPVELPPNRTLILELAESARAIGRPLRPVPLGALLGAAALFLLVSAWLIGRPVERAAGQVPS